MKWIIAFVVLTAILSVTGAARRKRNADTRLRISIKRDSWEEGFNTKRAADMGEITQIAEDTFCINPKSPLPLTLKNLSLNDAMQVRKLLDGAAQHEKNWEDITFFVAQHKIECAEVDKFIEQLRSEILSYVERRKEESGEWKSSSALDRKDLEREFQKDALENLSTRPSNAHALETLLFGSPRTTTADGSLLELFVDNKELYRFYLNNVERGAKIQRIVAENDWYRKNCEKLAELGVARRGKDIPIRMLLEQLRVKDINEYFSDRIDKPFTRRKQAFDFAAAQPDVIDVLSKHMSFRDRFHILEPKDITKLTNTGLDITEIRDCYAFAAAQAEMIRVTYVTGARTLYTLGLAKSNNYDYWGIDNRDCCSSCLKLGGKKTKHIPSRLPPFHVGCTCQLDGYYGRE